MRRSEVPTTGAVVRISGVHLPFSGSGIVHRELATRLGDHLNDCRVVDDFQQSTTFLRRLAGQRDLASDVLVSTSTPTPLQTRAKHLVSLVYDVRWRWTRGLPARIYRSSDLRSTALRAERIVTISHTVAAQLDALGVGRLCPVSVLDLGPGQFEGKPKPPVAERAPSVLLIGGAPHKRNEEAASLLASHPMIARNWRVIGISLSEQAEYILRSGFRPDQLTLDRKVGVDELASHLATATAYLALGESEGFGFPYIEAAYMGCDVVAVRQSVTQEILGDHAVYVGQHPTPDEVYVALGSWSAKRVTRLQKRAFERSWQRTAAQLATVIRRVRGS